MDGTGIRWGDGGVTGVMLMMDGRCARSRVSDCGLLSGHPVGLRQGNLALKVNIFS